jgi:hypothetical protein
MLLQRFTDIVLRNRWNAIAMAFGVAFIPLLGSVSILIAALVTLRKGAYEGSIVLCAATAPYLLTYIAYPAASSAEVAMFVTIIMIASNILTWVFALPLRHYNNWGVTLELAIIIGLVFICILHFVYPGLAGWWALQLNAYFDRTIALMGDMAATNPAFSKDIQAQSVSYLKQFATGLIVASLFLNALLQLLVARIWQSRIFNPGGVRHELLEIRFSTAMAAIFIAGLIGAYLANPIILDIMPLLYAGFGAVGLSLIHFFIAKTKRRWLWVGVIYIVIIGVFPLSLVIVALIGLLDTLLDFRKRLAFIN